MKKIIILAIAIVAVLALVGCSGDPDPIGDSSSSGGDDPSSSSVGEHTHSYNELPTEIFFPKFPQ